MKNFLFGMLLGSLVIFGCNTTTAKKIIPKQESKKTSMIFIERVPLFDQMYSVSTEDLIIGIDIAKATSLFYSEWIREYGDPDRKLLANLNNMNILWGTDAEIVTECNCFDINGKFLESAVISGLTHAPDTIWVWDQDGKISETSFVHELIHVALWSIDGNADPDHEGDKKVLWLNSHTKFIERVNKILKKNDL